MDDPPHDSAELPATSRATVVGLTALLAVALPVQAGLGRLVPAVVGAGVALSCSLWLVGWTRWTAVGRLLGSLLAGPTAVFLLVAAGGALGTATAPPTAAAATLVSLGCLLAVFGAVTAIRGVYDPERAIIATGVIGRTVVPLALSVVVGAVWRSQTPLAPLLDPVFAPAPGRTHIAVFCLFLSVTVLVFGRTLRALPLPELLTEVADDGDVAATVASVSNALVWGSLAAVCAGLLGLVVELGQGQAAIAGTLPPSAYDLLVRLTGSHALRTLLWLALVTSAVLWLAVWLLRRAARSSADRVGTVLAPYVGGCLLAVGLVAVATPLLERLRSIAPTELTGLLTLLVERLGAGPSLLAAGVALLSVAGCVTGVLWFVVVVNYLDERTPGVHVAAAGLFGASALAATLSVSNWLVFVGLVGSVVVWDAGTFGWTLDREVGGAAGTRRAQLTHTGGTVAVGGVGVVLTLAVLRVASGPVVAPSGVGYATLLIALFALTALVISLR